MRIPMMIAALWALAPAAQAVELGPLAPAAEGKVECVSPNPVAKTCHAISTITVAANGQIQDESVEMMGYGPVVIVTSRNAVQVRGDAECQMARGKDFATITFTIDGRPADAAQTARMRTVFMAGLKVLAGHTFCAVHHPQGDGILAAVQIDGTPAPQFDRRLMWVSPADGWKVGP